MKKLVLHVGAHKTATTSLQQFLNQRSDELLTQGVRYHVLSRPIRKAIQSALVSDRRARLPKTARLLATELAGEGSTLVSWEGFLGPPFWNGRLYGRSQAAAELIKALREEIDCPIEIVFYVRRQDTFVTSCYIQAVKEGSPATPDEYIGTIKFRSLDWQDCIAPLLQADLPVFYGAYELASKSVSEFVAPILKRFPVVSLPELDELPALNRAYCAKSLAIAQAANQVGLTDSERKSLRQLLDKFSGPSPEILQQIDFKRIRASCVTANSALLLKHLLLPPDVHEYYEFRKPSGDY